ncbi:MAG: glutamine--fructose-6-phosphate transaminase (isomerizing) [Endomicrobium sp.]|jgi:glucosamine--fructose-6-phosphate aminotransferase (isomerizing)|nr:glutamine--fructose-6-phosphate transaminase (isomerizing) [Endomicrobium sp.]
MCGIFGYIGNSNALKIIMNGLRKLEYRGYDSTGVALLVNNKLYIKKSIGNINTLNNKLHYDNHLSILKQANIGLGHTRWATNGKVTVRNAHPQVDYTKSFSIVHNGIIENYNDLKYTLLQKKYSFKSQTDTEVIINLVLEHYNGDLFNSVQQTLSYLRGSYAIGILCKYDTQRILCAKKDSPLIIGIGNGENFLASDVYALLPYTNKMIFLENGDIAELYKNNIKIKKQDGTDKELNICVIQDSVNINLSNKTQYKYFMLKEIYEQPDTIKNTYENLLNNTTQIIMKLNNIQKIYILGCGTAYYAGYVAKFWFEQFTKIPIEVDIASEFYYRSLILNSNTLVILISQSGETADTLAALRFTKTKQCISIAICNTFKSSISCEATYVLYTSCGIEIGVASTKAFTSQLTALFILSLGLGLQTQQITKQQYTQYLDELYQIPDKAKTILQNIEGIKKIAKVFMRKKNVLYLGRYINYPIALEGALKLKEVSYIHAEGCATGEIKHGTIALIDNTIPVLVILTKGKTYKKTLINIEEIQARQSLAVILTNNINTSLIKKIHYVISVPQTIELLSPILNVIPLQLLAYFTATFLKHNVDQPRNLAKSVTVE